MGGILLLFGFLICGAVIAAVYYMWFYDKYDKKESGDGPSDAASE